MDRNYEIIKYAKGPKKGHIEKILVDNYNNFYFWEYPEQTQIKHKVLYKYLDAWITILGSKNLRINYYDGFSGCGAYYDYHNDKIGWGSPLIAQQVAISRRIYNKCHFYLNENCENNIGNLKNVLKFQNLDLSKIDFTQEKYNDNINKFLDYLEKNPAPTFFMIDPYGIDVDFNTLKRIMSIPRTEIFLNFMYNYLNRFITNLPSETGINQLYGNTDWQKFRTYKENLKEQGLVELYRNKLKMFSKYTYQYRMSFPNQNKTYYYLFHITQNLKGCSIMKDAFASCNMGNVEFLGPNKPNPNQMVLLNTSDNKVENLKLKIWELYKGQTKKYSEILDEFIDSSPYLERHIKQSIQKLEGTYANFYHVKESTRTIAPDDTIEFFIKPKLEPKQISLF